MIRAAIYARKSNKQDEDGRTPQDPKVAMGEPASSCSRISRKIVDHWIKDPSSSRVKSGESGIVPILRIWKARKKPGTAESAQFSGVVSRNSACHRFRLNRRPAGQRGYGIGFIVFVFLALLSLAMTWVLKYGAARAAAMPPAADGISA